MRTVSSKDRAKALENQFYDRVDKEQLANIRRGLTVQDPEAALRSASGFRDYEVLTELVRIEAQPATMAAIAWADG